MSYFSYVVQEERKAGGIMILNHIYNGDSLEILKTLPDESIDCCVSSPPYYGLRDYGVAGQIGLEETPEQFIKKLVCVFNEVKRVLKPEGTLWVNMGDSYVGSGGDRKKPVSNEIFNLQQANNPKDGRYSKIQAMKREGLKPKDLIGIPWMLAFALRDKVGYYLRNDIVWNKPNPMPESVTDRCTKSHEYIFLLSKSANYYYDKEAIAEEAVYQPGSRKDVPRGEFNGKWDSKFIHISESFRAIREKKNKRDVWTVSTKPFKEAHFATFPPDLIEPCILAGCPENGIVLDCFFGAGTTGVVAKRFNRNYIGIELNPEYIKIAEKRIREDQYTRPTEQLPGQIELSEYLAQ
jgi:DNA modification methylase